MAKCTQAEVKRRIREVRRLLLKGYTRTAIADFCAMRWKIGARQTDDYIKAADQELDEINKNSAEQNLALITSNLWDLFRKHMKQKETGPARSVLLDIAKLRGLDRMDINVRIERPLMDASDEDLASLLGGP